MIILIHLNQFLMSLDRLFDNREVYSATVVDSCSDLEQKASVYVFPVSSESSLICLLYLRRYLV